MRHKLEYGGNPFVSRKDPVEFLQIVHFAQRRSGGLI
jgi:hypothetical protein